MPESASRLELAEWRRLTGQLYAEVRSIQSPEEAHRCWREGRGRLFSHHGQSPLPPGDALRRTGLRYWPYDAALRFALFLEPAPEQLLSLSTGGKDTTLLRRIGRIQLPSPIKAPLDMWWLEQYGGGLFLPIRDGTAGDTSYGGGRYLLDTAKGADLGTIPGDVERVIIDLNFVYHPSCRYDSRWQCPLAPAGNTISSPIQAGERL